MTRSGHSAAEIWLDIRNYRTLLVELHTFNPISAKIPHWSHGIDKTAKKRTDSNLEGAMYHCCAIKFHWQLYLYWFPTLANLLLLYMQVFPLSENHWLPREIFTVTTKNAYRHQARSSYTRSTGKCSYFTESWTIELHRPLVFCRTVLVGLVRLRLVLRRLKARL